MAAALTVTGAKAVDRIESAAESLSDSAFNPVPGLSENYAGDKGSLQQVINVPAGSFV